MNTTIENTTATETVNDVTNLVSAFIDQLNEQAGNLAVAIADLHTDFQTRLKTLTDQRDVVNRALAGLTGKPMKAASTTSGTKRVMSEAGKENIRKALQARRERLAAEAGGKVIEPVVVPSAATEEQGTTPEVAVKAVKTTKLEKDVLYGGLLLNNFTTMDGDEHNGVWSEQIITNGQTKEVTAKQLPGVVASLVKKGLVVSDGEAVKLTAAGVVAAREVANG